MDGWIMLMMMMMEGNDCMHACEGGMDGKMEMMMMMIIQGNDRMHACMDGWMDG